MSTYSGLVTPYGVVIIWQYQLISPSTKWPLFCRRSFQMHFRKLKVLYFYHNVIEVCYQGSNWQFLCTSLDNGLAPNRRQAIIWNNAEPIHWRIYVAPGADELNHPTEFGLIVKNLPITSVHVVTLFKHPKLLLKYIFLYQVTLLKGKQWV